MKPDPVSKPASTPGDELRFTQNFLHSKALVDKIVTLAKLQAGSTVLEIGPGKGIITAKLAERVTTTGKVIAIELDSTLATSLRDQFKSAPQVEIVSADILKFKLADLPPYVVFSNVPFNITSALLEHLFSPTSGPTQAHLILQKDALIATSEYGAAETFKSLLFQPIYQIDLVHSFARTDFIPQPGVETGLFAFTKRTEPLILPAQVELYKDFLAFVSKDRVGEGVWSRLFSKPQLQKLSETGEPGKLMYGRGLKSQSVAGIVSAFQVFITLPRPKQELVKGAMSGLREEQNRREQINRAGGHRRDTRRDNRPDHRRKPPR